MPGVTFWYILDVLSVLGGTRAPQYRFFIVFMRKVAQKGVANGDLLGSLASFWAIWGIINAADPQQSDFS